MSKPVQATIKPTVSFCGFCLKPFVRDDQCITHPQSGMSLHLMCARIVTEAVRQYDEATEAGRPAFGERLQKSPTVLGSGTAPEVGSASKEK